MLETERYNHEADGDSAAAYATDDEIAIADQLRHRLEELYFPSPASSLPSRMRPSEGH
jgi:hypothetical protein